MLHFGFGRWYVHSNGYVNYDRLYIARTLAGKQTVLGIV